MKRINLSLMSIFLLVSCVSVVFGSQITLGGKKPVNVHRSSYDSVRVRAEWKDGSIYTESQCGDITWTLENGRFFSQDKDGVIVQKWPDGSFFLKDQYNNIKCDIRNIGTFSEDQYGNKQRDGLQPEQIDYIKQYGCVFDSTNLDSYILPSHLLSKSKYEISDVQKLQTKSQKPQDQKQNVQLQNNNNIQQNNAQVVDSRFSEPTPAQEKERDERIVQNEKIANEVNAIKVSKDYDFNIFQNDGNFLSTEKNNILFFEYKNSQGGVEVSTDVLMGKILWLAAAIEVGSPFKDINSFFTKKSPCAVSQVFVNCETQMSVDQCLNHIKKNKTIVINKSDSDDEKAKKILLKNRLQQIVCLHDNQLTPQCEYIDLYFRIKQLSTLNYGSFALYVKNNESTIQSWIIKHNKKIAVVLDKQIDEERKNFIANLLDECSLSRQIAELEMKTTENWLCSKKILEKLGIDKKIIDDVEKAEKSKIGMIKDNVPIKKISTGTILEPENFKEKIARWWLYLKNNHPKLVAGVKAVGCAFAVICVYYLLSGIFGSSSVSSMSSGGISIVNSPHGSSISLPGIKINAGPGGSNISVGGASLW